MSTTISKSRLFRTQIVVDDDRLDKFKKFPEVAGKSMLAGAQYWHTGILPEHFKDGAHYKYNYANRSKRWLADRRKAGKPDMVQTGSMQRELQASAVFKIAGQTVTTKMHARVLNLYPNMPQNSDDIKVPGRTKDGKIAAFPNMKREVKIITDDEQERVANVIAGECEKEME